MIPLRQCLIRVVIFVFFYSLFVVTLSPLSWAQDPDSYSLQTGQPRFSANEPFPGGFVNLANGNVHFEIPLGSYTQRGALTVQLKLVYDSRFWSQVESGTTSFYSPITDPNLYEYENGDSKLGLGWRLVGEPKLVSAAGFTSNTGIQPNCIPTGNPKMAPGNLGPFFWTDMDGTEHIFPVYNACYAYSTQYADAYALDGSGYHLFFNTQSTASAPFTQIYARDGSLVYQDPANSNCTNGNCSQTITLTDTNGNSVQWEYLAVGANYPDFPKIPTDTVGRSDFSMQTSGNSEGVATVSTLKLMNSQSNNSTATLNYANRSGGGVFRIRTKFGAVQTAECWLDTTTSPCSAQSNVDFSILQSVVLPDGSTYSFTYDCYTGDASICTNSNWTGQEFYGELLSVTLPTGGSINFSYSNFQDALGLKNRWVTGITYGGGTWTYTPQVASGCGTSYCQKVTVALPSGDNEVHSFDLSTYNGAWDKTIQYFKGAVSGTPVLTVSNNYESFLSNYSFWSLNASTGSVTYTNVSGYTHLKNTTTAIGNSSTALTNETALTYDAFTAGSNCAGQVCTVTTGKLLNKQEFAFGTSGPGILLRQTAYSYQDDSNTNYRTTVNGIINNIMDRVTDMKIQDGNNNLIAETKIQYDAPSQLVSIKNIENHSDANYDTGNIYRGNPTLVQKLVTGTSFINTGTITYDTTGQPTSIKDGNGNVTNFSYQDAYYTDASPVSNPPTPFTPTAPSNAYLTKVTVPIIGAGAFGYYFGTGQQAMSIDQNGADSYWHYLDSLNRITHSYSPSTINKATNLQGRGWTLRNYSPGSVQTDFYSAINDASPSTSCTSCAHTRVLLDSLGRRSQQSLMSDPQGTVNVDFTYDISGRSHTVSDPYRSKSESTYGAITLSFDNLGRTSQITDADGSKSGMYYGADVTNAAGLSTQLCTSNTYGVGYPSLRVDEAGKILETWTDGLGRLIETDEPNSSGTLAAATCYIYNVLGNVTAIVQTGGSASSSQWRNRSFVFDGLSRLTSSTDPESGVTTYVYDNNNNLLTKTSPAPNQTGTSTVTISFCYDALNRVTQKAYTTQICTTNGVLPNPVATFTYDLASIDNFTITNPKGRLIKGATSGNFPAATYFTYDQMGRITNQGQCVYQNSCGSSHPTLWVVTNGYDFAGDLISYTDGGANTFTQQFDTAGRPSSISSSWNDSQHPANLLTVQAYSPASTVTKALLGNGLTQTVMLNTRFQPCRINWNSSSTALSSCGGGVPSGNVLDYTYGYNVGASDNANIASWTAVGVQTFSRSYTYDPLNRLSTYADSASVQNCKALNWTIDAWGNRTDQSIGTNGGTCNQFHQIVNANNRFSGTGSGYSYDAAGNLTGDNVHAYAYDTENRIQYVDYGANQYVYDAFGRRVAKAVGSTTTFYVYGSDGRVVSDFNALVQWNQTYIRFGGALVAVYGGNLTGFYHRDHLGSTRLVTLYPWVNTSQSIYDNMDFLPFGEQITSGGASAFRFTSQERDGETGLDFFGARHYSSSLGRFMTVDPSRLSAYLENPQSFNRYAYVYGRPTIGRDPDGKCPPCAFGALAGGLLSGGVEAYLEYRNTGHVNGRNVTAAFFGGAVAGGLSGGLSVFAEGFGVLGTAFSVQSVMAAGAIGAVSNTIGGGVARGLSADPSQHVLDKTAVKDFGIGFVGGGLGQVVGNLAYQELGGAYNFRTTLFTGGNYFDSRGALKSAAQVGASAANVTAGAVVSNVAAPIFMGSYMQSQPDYSSLNITTTGTPSQTYPLPDYGYNLQFWAPYYPPEDLSNWDNWDW
jgi:RHS repeat-associated protein